MAKINWKSKKELEEQEKAIEKANREKETLEKAIPAMLTAVRKLVRVDELTPEELMTIIDLYPDWAPEEVYEKDQILQYGTQLYRVVQGHSPQSDWLPDATPALYTPINPPDTIGEWVQPTGGHDAYNIGDKVIFKGEIYESIIDGNIWSPTAHPQGWQLIE